MDLVKRTAIPMIIALVISTIGALIMF